MRLLSISHQRDAGPGVFCEAIAAAGVELDEWFIAERDAPPADPLGYDAVMSFGGAMHAHQEDEHPYLAEEKALLRELLRYETPLLAVCLGAQLLSEAAGGHAHLAPRPEIGWYDVAVTEQGAEDALIGPLAPGLSAFEWHSYACGVPDEALVLARNEVCTQAFRVGEVAWGIQFHAEVSVADVTRWIDTSRTDPDAVRAGVDPDALRAETLPRMPDWNRLGRELCDRFLTAAVAHNAPRVSPLSA